MRDCWVTTTRNGRLRTGNSSSPSPCRSGRRCAGGGGQVGCHMEQKRHLVYSVESLPQYKRQSIGDLLRRLPGVEVSEAAASSTRRVDQPLLYRGARSAGEPLRHRHQQCTGRCGAERGGAGEPPAAQRPARPGAERKASHQPAPEEERCARQALSPLNGDADGRSGWPKRLPSARAEQAVHRHVQGQQCCHGYRPELTEQSLAGGDAADAASGYSPVTLLSARSFSLLRWSGNGTSSTNRTPPPSTTYKTGEHSQLRLNIQYLHDERRESILRNSEYYLPVATC